MKRKVFPLILISLVLICCSETKEESIQTSSLDTSNVSIIHLDCENDYHFKGYSKGELTIEEVQTIEGLIVGFIDEYNADQKVEWSRTKDLRMYKRQYVPLINSDGERIIWVNFYCPLPGPLPGADEYEKVIFHMNDGGNCQFNFKINLAEKEIYDFSMNGEA